MLTDEEEEEDNPKPNLLSPSGAPLSNHVTPPSLDSSSVSENTYILPSPPPPLILLLVVVVIAASVSTNIVGRGWMAMNW